MLDNVHTDHRQFQVDLSFLKQLWSGALHTDDDNDNNGNHDDNYRQFMIILVHLVIVR